MPAELDEIERICSRYGIDEINSVTPLSDGYANINYKIVSHGGSFFYRVCTQHNDMEAILYEIAVLKELKKMGFPAAFMIQTIDGTFMSESSLGPVLIYEFKQGTKPVLNPETAGRIARAAARLNSFEPWKNYPRKNSIHMDYCHELILEFKTALFQFPEIFRYFEDQTHYLEEPLSQELPKGLIHGDIFPDNTLFQGNRLVAVIDFEEACVDHLLMEIGMCINGFCFIDNTLCVPLMETFLTEYNKIRTITEKEWELLFYYIQWGAHGMLSWHLRHHLIYRENPRQLARVLELMERVKELRKNGFPAFIRP